MNEKHMCFKQYTASLTHTLASLQETDRQARKIHVAFLAALEGARLPAHNSTQHTIDDLIWYINVRNIRGSRKQWGAIDATYAPSPAMCSAQGALGLFRFLRPLT